jgi:hypothetical protein
MTSDKAIEDGCIFDLAIGSVFQDEARYLKEWIEFHKMMGVQNFILVNDRSTDNYAEVLQPYVDAGEVALFSQHCPPKWSGKRWVHYQWLITFALLEHLRGIARWVAIIDIDEFLVPAEADDLPTFLADYEDCGGIYVRWEPFGTGYIDKLADEDLLTDRLHLKWRFIEGYKMLGKSVVKPHRVLRSNIHRYDLLPGYKLVDSNPGMKNKFPRIRLNHYWARDEHFLLNVKLPRIARLRGLELDEKRIEVFKHLFNDVPDHSMQRFTRELRSRVFNKRGV